MKAVRADRRFRYRLFLADGTDLNDVETTTTRYEIGDLIDCVDACAYRVVDLIDRAPDYGGAPFDETSQYVAFLFVEPL
jgi:hypothetical protein